MPPMRPNSAIIVAVVTGTEVYNKQTNFSVLFLTVKNATPKGGEAFLFSKEDSINIKALISTEDYKNANIKSNNTITVEAKKVSVDMWRIIKFIST